MLAGDYSVGPDFLPGIGAIDNVPPRNIGTVAAYQVVESENANGRGINDTMATAERLPLGTLSGQQHTIDVQGYLPARSQSPLNGTQFEDVDFYRVELRAGDILDVATTGAAGRFDVLRGNGQHWFGTMTNMGILYPSQSPLQDSGVAVAAQVVPADGTYYIRVAREITGSSTTQYQLGLRVYRPVMESAPIGTQQIIYLDFDGGMFPTSLFFESTAEAPLPSTIQIPSLSESLTYLGFDLPIVPTPESTAVMNKFIDDVVSRVEDDFNIWMPLTGGNGDFNQTGIPGQYGVQILNSRDHADPGDSPYVTRVFIGGATDGVIFPDGLYGIAQTIDIGNFAPAEYVLTLLDWIGTDAQELPISLTASRLEIAAQGAALTISHELAHSFGVFHTDRAGGIRSIIDANVDINDDYELGLDGVFGTADDIDMPFPERDRFNPVEGMLGFNHVTAAMAWGLATGKAGSSINGTVYNDVNGDAQRGNQEAGLSGVTVFVDANRNGQLDPGEISTTTAANGAFTLPVASGTHSIVVIPRGDQVATTGVSKLVAAGSGSVLFGLHAVNQAVTGVKFEDLNGNGVRDPGEPGIEGVYIYVDLDRDGSIDLGEPRAITNSKGEYTLDWSRLQTGGTYHVREVVGPGFEQVAPAEGFYSFTFDPANPPTGLNFANRVSRDFGDAPDDGIYNYQTLQANGGPSHAIVPGVHLGNRVDGDQDGQPTIGANGDDLNGLNDEDGVWQIFDNDPDTLKFEVIVSNTSGQPGYLQAWFDFDRDGTFGGPGEQVVIDGRYGSGEHLIEVPIPDGATPGELYTRWRYSLTPGLGIGGAAASGEVEDHLFTIPHLGGLAGDDQITIPRNSTAVPIDVLANDYETPDNRLTITGRDLTGTRGTVTTSVDGRMMYYTPPLGFIGQDQFTYTVTPEFGDPATATVTINVAYQNDVPVAIDDTFEVAQGSTNVALNVLDNDLPSSLGGMTIVSVTSGSEGGTTSLVGGNQSVRYTPRPGFAGTEEFVYTVSDADGNFSSATVTVNLLPGSYSNDVVAFDVEFLDLVNGQPITDIQAGAEFLVRVSVEDVRESFDKTGVYSAFLDLLYNDQLVSVLPDSTNPLGFAIQFSGEFDSAAAQGLQSGDATTPGLLNEVGSQRGSLTPPTEVAGPVELFTVRMRAMAPGIAVFSANPADEPMNETSVYSRMDAIGVAEQRLGISELVISPAGDAFTSAIDDAYSDGRDSNRARIAAGQAATLDVLANDLLGPTDSLAEFFLVSQPNHGLARVSGGVIVYTPDQGVVNQFDSFSYGIVTADGVRSLAEVTLFVGDPIAAQQTAPEGAKPFDVDISLRAVDGAGNPITQVTAGSRFGVQVYLQDLRSSFAANPLGVFAAFTDILYDAGMARPSDQIQGDPFDFDVVFAPEFGVTGAFGVASRPGIIDEFGSFLRNTNPSNVPPHPALSGDPVLMATLYFDAIGTGEFRMATSPADATPYRDTLLFQPADPVEVSRIRYDVLTVNITGGRSGEGEPRQNALLPADVNGDGHVTPIDALLVLNELAQRRFEGEASPSQPHHFADVNGDSIVSPLDALRVLNHLSDARAGAVPLTLEQVAQQSPSAEGVIPVDTYRAVDALRMARYTPPAESSDNSSGGEGEAVQAIAPPVDQVAAAVNDEDEDRLLWLLADDVASRWQ